MVLKQLWKQRKLEDQFKDLGQILSHEKELKMCYINLFILYHSPLKLLKIVKVATPGEAIIEMREAENGGSSSESDVEGGEEVGDAFPSYIATPPLSKIMQVG